MAQEIGIVVMYLVRCPALVNEALTFLRDEPAAASSTCSTSRTTALVLRNPLTPVLQLLRFLTACRCVRDASGPRATLRTAVAAPHPAEAADRSNAARCLPFGSSPSSHRPC
jgi:hypothetical protein